MIVYQMHFYISFLTLKWTEPLKILKMGIHHELLTLTNIISTWDVTNDKLDDGHENILIFFQSNWETDESWQFEIFSAPIGYLHHADKN